MTEQTNPAPAPAATAHFEEITLETGIVRGGQTFSTLRIRKPKAGELRGLQLDSLMSGDVNAVMSVLPRISSPSITAEEAEGLEMPDLIACAGAIKGFFMSKETQTAMARFMGIVETEESTG